MNTIRFAIIGSLLLSLGTSPTFMGLFRSSEATSASNCYLDFGIDVTEISVFDDGELTGSGDWELLIGLDSSSLGSGIVTPLFGGISGPHDYEST
jgi:hypothetical protein